MEPARFDLTREVIRPHREIGHEHGHPVPHFGHRIGDRVRSCRDADRSGSRAKRVPKLLLRGDCVRGPRVRRDLRRCSRSCRTQYHLPTYGLGLIAGTSFLAGLGAQIGLARYADRGYTRLLLRLGLAVAAVGMLWFGLASQLWEFIGARLLLGLGSGMFVPAARRVVVARSGENAGEALGRLASFEVAGFISGPPIAAVLAALFGLHAPFIILAVALAVTSPAVARLDEPPVGGEAAEAGTAGSGGEPRRAFGSCARRCAVPLHWSVRRDLGEVHDRSRREHHGHRGDPRAVRTAAGGPEPVRGTARGPPGSAAQRSRGSRAHGATRGRLRDRRHGGGRLAHRVGALRLRRDLHAVRPGCRGPRRHRGS